MANETMSQPSSGGLTAGTSLGEQTYDLRAQLYPQGAGAGGTDRPTEGQIWPRGNVRGNT